MNPTWLFVAAAYAVAVAGARRAGVALPTRIAVLFYLLVLGFLFEPMTGRFVNVHADVIKTLPPWNLVMTDHSTANPAMNDVPLQEVPWAHAVRESWKSLSAPLWNPTTGCGMPLLANAQSQGLSLLRLIALPLDLGHSMTAEAALKLLIALTFMFLYCRRYWSEPASIVAAVSFAFSGFLFVWLHFPHTTAGCLLPGVLYFVDLLVERASWARFTGAAVLWATILFAGHPETAVHLFLAGLAYALWLWPGMKTFARLAGALVVAGLLAAPFLATFGDAMTKSRRFYEVRDAPYADVPLPYSDLRAAVVVLQPLFFGPLREPWGPSEGEALAGFGGVLGVVAWLAVAWSVIATRAWRSREAFFVLISLLIVGVIFEWPGFTDVLHFLIPIGAHARLRVVLVCALAIQAAAAIDHSRARRTPLLVALGIVGAAIVAILSVEFPEVVRDRRPFVLRAAIPAAVVLLTSAALVITRAKIAFVAMFASVIAELWFVGRGFNPPTPDTLMYPRTAILDKLHELQRGAKEPFRITGYAAMLFQNTPALFGLEDIRVHDPMTSNRYLEFLGATAKYDAKEYFGMWTDTDTHVLDFLNVRYLVTDPGVPVDRARWTPVYEGPDGQVFENRTVLPRFFAPPNVVIEFDRDTFARRLREMDDKWSHTALLDRLQLENRRMHDDFFNPRPVDARQAVVKIVEAGATQYRVRTTAPRYTLVASSIPWWPGWKVERNGKRIEPIRVNGAFLGFAVAPGQSDVRVWYAPATWWYGSIVSAATLLALIAFRIRSARWPVGSRPSERGCREAWSPGRGRPRRSLP